MGRLVVHDGPLRAAVCAGDDGGAVDEGGQERLALARRVELQTTGPFGAAFDVAGVEALPGLALVAGAVEAAVTHVDKDVAGLMIDEQAAQPAVAGLLRAEQLLGR